MIRCSRILFLLLASSLTLTISCNRTTGQTATKAYVKKVPRTSRGIAPVKKSTRIALDAGHGGDDYGTYSASRPRYHEKFLTLATVYMVRDHLERLGYSVSLTRDEDKFISLDQRVTIGKNNHADLFVSVHYNSAPSHSAHGVEVFYYRARGSKERADRSQILAKKVLDGVISTTQAKSRKVKVGNFAVIRNTTMPAILVEGGFLTNDDEMAKIRDPKYLNKIAWGIAKGVDEFVQNKH
jgi:N-acetylmuramoyl-L-alanine amidase